MSAAQLITDLARLGVRIEAHGDRLRYTPRSAVTPDLADRMKAQKGELLAILRCDSKASDIDLTNATAVWRAPLDRLDGDLLFPPDEMEALRAADAQWGNDPKAGDSWEDAIEPPDPCPKCRTLELWQSLAGNWHCLRCDPPVKARRLRDVVAQRHGGLKVDAIHQ